MKTRIVSEKGILKIIKPTKKSKILEIFKCFLNRNVKKYSVKSRKKGIKKIPKYEKLINISPINVVTSEADPKKFPAIFVILIGLVDQMDLGIG